MKLAPRTFRTFWDVHAWAGVLVGLLLHLMFFAGAFALFHEPLRIWGDPFLQRPAPSGLDARVDALVEEVRRGLPIAPDRVQVNLPTGAHGLPQLCFTHPVTKAWTCAAVDPKTGEAKAEREHVASFLFDLHYLWFEPAPWLYRA